MLINTINSQSEKFKDWTIPFAVSFGEIVIHRYYMNSFTSERKAVTSPRSSTFEGCSW